MFDCLLMKYFFVNVQWFFLPLVKGDVLNNKFWIMKKKLQQ